MNRNQFKVTRIFLIAAVLLLASMIGVYVVGRMAIDANRKLVAQRAVIGQLEQYLSVLKDAETGQRGYLLTGDERYLEPYQQARQEIQVSKEALRQFSNSGDLPSAAVDLVSSLTDQKLAELERTIQARRERSMESATNIVREGTGLELMNKIRAAIADMQNTEQLEFDEAAQRSDRAVTLRTATFIAIALFNLGFLAWAYRRMANEIRSREAAVLEASRERQSLATTLASIGDGVIATDMQGRVRFLNSEAERLTGWKNSEAIGAPLSNVFRIVNEQTRNVVENPVEKVLRIGNVVGLANHTALLAKDGRETAIDDSAAPIRAADGSLYGVVLVFRDVAEQRKAQLVQAHLAAIVEHSGDAIATKNLNGVIQSWNASAEKLFGYTAAEIIGKNVTILIPGDRIEEEAQILSRIRHGQSSERIETLRMTKDGRQIPVSVSVSPIKDVDGQVVGASKVIHDISDVVAAREALSREKEWLDTTLASIGDAVILTDSQGRISFLNMEAERLTGWKRAEAIGKPLLEVFHIIKEESRLPAENPVDKVLQLGIVVGLANHTLLVRRDGTEIPIDDSAAPIRQDGGPLFGVVLVFRDFTERKNFEKPLVGARLEAERAGTIKDEFLANLSHELRTPLNAILGFATLIRMGNLEDPDTREGLEIIERNAKSQAQLIDDLLDMNRIVSGKIRLDIRPLELIEIVKAALTTVRPSAEAKNILLKEVVESPSIYTYADAARMQQVMWNLLSNAVKFTPEGGTVSVTVERVNSTIQISVSDTGQGIDAEFLPFVFDRFRQADSTITRGHAGLGLGLSIVKQLVELHGGSVQATSPGKNQGATFVVSLPLAAEAHRDFSGKRTSGVEQSVMEQKHATLSGIRVLVVDDEPDATSLVERILKPFGAEVVSASSVHDALNQMDQAHFGVLISDVGMPGEDGYELIRQVKARDDWRRNTKAVALSAFARTEDRQRAIQSGFDRFLSKPLDGQELIATIALLANRTKKE